MRPVKIHHVVVLEEPGAPGRSLYLGSLGQEQNCCDWRGPENDSRGQERTQGLRCHLCHEHHSQEGNYPWQIKRLAQDEKARLAQQRGGIASASRARREWGDSREVGCMVTLSEVEELPVGPELNDVGQVQEGEGARDASGCRAVIRLSSDSPAAQTISANLPQMNLAEQHVPGSKNTYYIPDFVTTEEETYLLRKVSWQNLPITHTPTPSGSGLPTYADSGDASAEMEATFEPEVCCIVVDSRFTCQQTGICNRLQTWGDSSG
jgi:hypothetical protein